MKLKHKLILQSSILLAFAPAAFAISCKDEGQATTPQVVTKEIVAADRHVIDLPSMTEAQALTKYNEIETLKNTKGKHIHLTINSKTTPSTSGTMVYAVKTDAEGFSSTASSNLIAIEGTKYKGYTHTIDGAEWAYASSVTTLIDEWKTQAGIGVIKEVNLVSTGYTPSVFSIDLNTATPSDAAYLMFKKDENEKIAGKHFAIKIKTKTNADVAMVYAMKTVAQGYVVGADPMSNLLPFDNVSGHNYDGYRHTVDGVEWGHNQAFYVPMNEVRALAAQHTVTRIDIPAEDHITINMQGMTQPEAAVLNDKLITFGNTPGKHFAVTITNATGTTTATMVYAIKTTEDGFVGSFDRPGSTYRTDGTATGKYIDFTHYIAGSATPWAHQMAYNQVLPTFRTFATTIAIPAADVHTVDLTTISQADALTKYNEIEALKNTKGKHFAVKIISDAQAGVSATMVYAVKNDSEGYSANAASNLLSIASNKITKYSHTIDGTAWTVNSNFDSLLTEWKTKAGVTA